MVLSDSDRASARLTNLFLCLCALGLIVTTVTTTDALCSVTFQEVTVTVGVFRMSDDGEVTSTTYGDLSGPFRVAQGTGVTSAVLIFLTMCSLVSHYYAGVGKRWVKWVCSAAIVMTAIFWVSLISVYTHNYAEGNGVVSLSKTMHITYGIYISVLAMVFMIVVQVVFYISERKPSPVSCPASNPPLYGATNARESVPDVY